MVSGIFGHTVSVTGARTGAFRRAAVARAIGCAIVADRGRLPRLDGGVGRS